MPLQEPVHGARRNRRLSLALLLAAALSASGCQTTVAQGAANEIVEINVTNDPSRVDGQPAVVVNPRNRTNLAYVSTHHEPGDTAGISGLHCYAAHSQDGGQTWSETAWPYGDRPNCGDPYLAADSTGTFFLAFNRLCPRDVPCPAGPSAVAVARSTDGGRTWSAPVDTVPRSVTPRLRVDAASGHIYAVGGLGRGNDPISVTVSTDHGLTWGPGRPLPAQPFGNQIAVYDGVLATATALSVEGTRIFATEIKFSVSTDGGQTFSTTTVTDSNGAAVAPPEGLTVPNGQTLNGETLAASDPIPLISADPSRRGRFSVIVQRGRNFEIYITDNSGRAWRGPTLIEAPNAARPWIEYGPDGNLGVMWRTFVNARMDAFSVVSFDGGRTFSAPVKVNRVDQPYLQTQAGGDEWSRILLDDRYAYVTWSDSRTGGHIDGILSRVPLSLYRRIQ